MKKNFSFAFISNIVSSACKFLILLLIIKLGTPSEVGIYNYALIISAPVFLFTSLKIRSIQVTNNNYKFNEYYSLIIIINILALLMIVVFSVIIGTKVVTYSIIIVSIIKVLDNLKEVIYGLYQKHENLKLMGRSIIISNIFNLIIFSITYFFSSDLLVSLSMMLLISIMVFLLYDLNVLNKNYNTKLEFNIKTKDFFDILILAIPLSVSSSLGSLNTSIPRIILKNSSGEYYLGIFSAIAYILVLANLFANSMSQVFMPRLSQYFHQNKRKEFNKLANILLMIGFAIGLTTFLMVLLFGKAILNIGFGEIYGEYYLVLVILSIGLLFLLSGVFAGTIITSTGNYKIHYKITTISLVVTIILSILTINKFSIYGTAVTIMFSQISSFICYIYFYIKLKKKV
ncbi:oligosaccharide flippase family protein [Mammaliicoccus sciuri]|uniref:oligosaccharide flippase family protein n=1 Tax=Mammaliicoccus sciuri TaxID=1296 RepID=UPI001FB1EC62|nr:oligosaccharide flippase family protein [Mammaliicoccus sciuri]MCJ0971250.1 oligosaccharide flippase family protein [Mammaliicoccus sciuri]MEB7815608.1 oligosaccharide flippase family protein [Mammaliicoccus sciuri]WQJ41851.1 oligosaccharide flippase family protein [Mammaliicoccus sciuri]